MYTWIVDGRTVGFEIVGEAFLWNQVRRTAMALHLLALGEISTEDVQRAIDEPENEVDFGVAPPDWLILWGVEWQDAQFLNPMTQRATFHLLLCPAERLSELCESAGVKVHDWR